MLPITHTGAARGCRESSRTQFLCSHPDLVEGLSAQKQSRVAEKCEAAAKNQCPVLCPSMDSGQSPAPVSSQGAPLAAAPQQRLRHPQFSEGPAAQTCCPNFSAFFSHRNPSRKEEGKKSLKKRRRNREQDRQICSISCIIHRKNPRSGEELDVKAGFTT